MFLRVFALVAVISAIVVGTMDHPASEENVDKKEGMLGYLVRQRMYHFLIYIRFTLSHTKRQELQTYMINQEMESVFV